MELRDPLGASTGLALPATLIFDYPTSTALVEFLRTALDLDDADEPVLDELNRLENAVARTDLDGDTRAQVVQRLQSLLSRCTPAGDGGTSIVDQIDAADDEMFALIDQEFGAQDEVSSR